MEYIFAGIGLFVIIIALFYLTFFSRKKNVRQEALKKNALVNCPICGSPLFKGENIVSKVYRPMNVPDQRCTVSGCPHCYPVCEVGGTQGLSCVRKKYSTRRIFGFAAFQQNARQKACDDCRLQSMPAQRSAVIFFS